MRNIVEVGVDFLGDSKYSSEDTITVKLSDWKQVVAFFNKYKQFVGELNEDIVGGTYLDITPVVRKKKKRGENIMLDAI